MKGVLKQKQQLLPVKILSSNILKYKKKKLVSQGNNHDANTVHVEEHIISSSLNNQSQSNNEVNESYQWSSAMWSVCLKTASPSFWHMLLHSSPAAIIMNHVPSFWGLTLNFQLVKKGSVYGYFHLQLLHYLTYSSQMTSFYIEVIPEKTNSLQNSHCCKFFTPSCSKLF